MSGRVTISFRAVGFDGEDPFFFSIENDRANGDFPRFCGFFRFNQRRFGNDF